MPRCLVALGSNLGDREQSLAKAIDLLAAEPGVKLLARSRMHRTAPIGGPSGQGDYLNAAVSLDVAFSPEQLMSLLTRIEGQLGRTRQRRWDARPIDLDLLLYDSLQVDSPALSLPHPRMAFRRFVLEPAAEVAPDMVHPATGWSVSRLLDHLNTTRPYLAMMGVAGTGKTLLARQLASAVGGRFLADPAEKTDEFPQAVSSGRDFQRQIEFLVRREQMLAAEKWPSDQLLTASDFYFDQVLAYARIELDDVDQRRFEAAWTDARQRVASPRLVVLLDTVQPIEQKSVRAELLRLASHRGIGPVHVIHEKDTDRAGEELAAAAAAMQ